MIRSFTALAAALVLSACSPQSEPATSKPVGAPVEGMGGATMADFRTDISMADLMAHVIDYNAFGVWHRQGWIIGDTVQELFPVDDEGWHAAESAAFSTAEAANLLLLPGRPLDDDRAWVDAAHMLYDASMKAQAAALARDKVAFFYAGSDMYQACVACHNRYVAGDMGPDTTLKPMPGGPPPPNQ
ncbi:MAG: hypothetical protein RIR33_2717 [Pseudomonadota bacterium]|jgi:mono/diheme cytochrome c family protein